MTEKTYWQGDNGPFTYDDAVQYDPENGDTSTQHAFRTDGQALIGEAPTVDTHVLRLIDLTTAINKSAKVVATKTGIDGKVATTTNLFTADGNLLVTGLLVEVTALTGLSAAPILGVGVASGEDDIILPTELLGLAAAGDIWFLSPIGKIRKVALGEVVKLGIDTGATATTLTLTVSLIAIYL